MKSVLYMALALCVLGVVGCGSSGTINSSGKTSVPSVSNTISPNVTTTQQNSPATTSAPSIPGADMSFYTTMNGIMEGATLDIQQIGQDTNSVVSGDGTMSAQDLSDELQTDYNEYQHFIQTLQATSPTSIVLSSVRDETISAMTKLCNDMSDEKLAADQSDLAGISNDNTLLQGDYSDLNSEFTTVFTNMQNAGIQPMWNPSN